jgi:tRNA(adenine34) deaminase
MIPPAARDAFYIGRCLHLADEAARLGEVPVGAVIVDPSGAIVAEGFNLRETEYDATAHAEVVALREASRLRRRWYLDDLTLYVTLEPCVMCAGALVQARIARVVYGCTDPKGGAMGSLYDVPSDARLNHRFPYVAGIRADECAAKLRDFFRARRGHTTIKGPR